MEWMAMAKTRGPFVVNRDGRLIGHLWQKTPSEWIAYNKVHGAPFWTKRTGTKAECTAWLEAVAKDPSLLKEYGATSAAPIR